MPTRILDHELTDLPQSLESLDGWDRVMMLLRIEGIPLGRVVLPVADGRVAGEALRQAAVSAVVPAAVPVLGAAILGLEEPRRPAAPATVAVCTRERPDDLAACLDSLACLPDDGQEILVVDNRPTTDRTRRLIESRPGVRYVREDRRGLNNARNRALIEAHRPIVAFIDDDARADQNWLRALTQPFGAQSVMCVTGLTMPLELETRAQEIFEDLVGFANRGFRAQDFQSPPHSPSNPGMIGAGANMALRRSVVEEIGLFDPALDAGTVTESGGDHEFFSRLLRAGHRITYRPAALNWHRHRRTDEELRRAVFGYGCGLYAAWTRGLVVDRDWTVLRPALRWLFTHVLPAALMSFVREDPRRPAALARAELAGSLAGPYRYFLARRQDRIGHAS